MSDKHSNQIKTLSHMIKYYRFNGLIDIKIKMFVYAIYCHLF